MSEQIRMVFEDMNEMIKALQEGSDGLAEVETQVKAIATSIDEGALQGKAGSRFSELLTDTLSPGIIRLKEKVEEMRDDVKEAVHQMENADKIAGDYYKK